MHEHTIPESLIEQIRTGRAALVVGAGIGVPSWKQMLERMTKALETRGREGDEAATKDLEKLLHKGSLSRAVGFLARALGEDVCDRIVQEMWAAPAETPAIPKILATLPFRHVWTTFPGDILEHAFETSSPDGWPPTRVVSYQELGELSPRRRTLVKMLGNFDTYVVTPRSVRRALSHAVDLREYVRELYVEGSLVFVGFRYGDPDLSAMLDRVFGMFEPPKGTHYFLGASLGPVTVDEMMADHHIEVINLAGKGGDEVAERSVLDWLEALKADCVKANVSLAQTRPDADDVDGWVAMLGEGGDEAVEARDALELIERKARDNKKWDVVVEVILGKIEAALDAERAQNLVSLAMVYEEHIGDLSRAFEAVTTACQIAPDDDQAAQLAEKLAAATGNWADLVQMASEIATEATDPKLASKWWARLGHWYSAKLDRADYALPSLRRALELDPQNRAAYAALAEAQRKGQKWSELADTLRAHSEVETDAATKTDLLIGLGDLSETQLASTQKAIDAYELAAEVACDVDDKNATLDDALAALERLYRRDEKWADLAKVLDRRAEIQQDNGDTNRAAAIRAELARLRAEKLGDLEGAITRYEAAVTANGSDAQALKALVDLYDKTGRTDDYLRARRCPRVVVEHRDRSCGGLLFFQRVDREHRPRMRCDRQLRVDLGAGHALEQLAAILALGAQERGEVALREQRRAAKLIERQTEPLMDRLEGLGLRSAEPLRHHGVLVERHERDLLVLQVAIGRTARASHRPARTVAPRIAALEIDLGPALRSAAAQQRARVLRAECEWIFVAVANDDAAVARQPRRAIEQRDAHRIEQRALAGAGRTDDREHSGDAEWPVREIDLELASEAREVAAADREDLHDNPPSDGCVIALSISGSQARIVLSPEFAR